MSRRALSRSLAQTAAEAQETALHSATTIASRLPVFAGLLVAPTSAGLAEWNRAYAEKVAAAWEGAFAAGAAWQAMMLSSAFRPPTATAAMTDCLAVMRKARGPARKRVKANAKRLSRRKAR